MPVSALNRYSGPQPRELAEEATAPAAHLSYTNLSHSHPANPLAGCCEDEMSAR
jgi:hypothetical protein